MKITIFADATSNLFKEILQKKNTDIKILNMHLKIGEHTYNCYDDEIDIKDFSKVFFEAMKQGDKVNTSLISPGEYLEAFEKEVAQGNKVICFTMAKGISGTYESARLAQDEINEKYSEEMVHIVDSMTAGLGEGLQALHADELVKQGLSFDEIIKEVESFKHKVRSEFTVDDIKYLLGTGRVGKYLAKFVRLVNMKVLLKSGKESKIAFAGPAFGRKNAIKKLSEMVLKKADRDIDQIYYVTHCNILEDAEKLKNLLVGGGLPEEKIEIYDYDLISGAHIGPNSLAVFYLGKSDKDEDEEKEN